jgi:peptide/nickel transport system substrate-binding protein
VRRLGAAVGLLVLVGAAGCGGGSSTTTSGADDTTTTGASAPTKTLRYGMPAASIGTGVSNPAAFQGTGGPILTIAYEPLLYADPQGKIGPGLAEKWGYVGDDYKVFELTLRPDARFSDGSPVTAAAVVKWLNYFRESKNPMSGLMGPDPKFEAVDKRTVRITLTAPLPGMPALLSQTGVNWGFVAAPKAVSKPDLFTKATYGAGPYMLDYGRSVPGDHYTFVPNPYYYDKSAIRFKEIYLKGYKDAASQLQAQQAGQLDVGWSTDASTAPAAESAGLDIVSAPLAVGFVQLNVKASKALADVRVRRAMNHALDRQAITNALYGKYGTATSQPFITSDANPGLDDYYAYDPDKAKSLLAEAGYPDGFSFTLNSTVPTKEAELVADALDAVGIKTKVESFTTAGAYFEAIYKFKDDGWILHAGVGDSTPGTYGPWIGPDSTFRPGEPIDPKVDELYNAGLKSSDPSGPWKQMWALTVTDAWFLPYASSNNLMYVSKDVGGVEMSDARPFAYAPEWFFK